MAGDRRLIGRAALLMAALLALGALLWPLPPSGAGSATEAGAGSDIALYRAVAARVAAGEAYVPAAMAEQRARNFPVKPGAAVRPPLLAHLLAAGETAARIIFFGLVGLTLLAWRRRGQALALRPLAIALLLASIALPAALHALGAGLWFHETWAGLLIALSLGLWRPGAWRASLAAGLAAMLIREFALAYGLLMLIAALIDRRRGEVAGWAAALAIAGAALGLHWNAVAAGTLPGDPGSPGWSGLLGPGFAVDALRQTSLLAPLPFIVAALLVPFATAGWAAAGAAGQRTALVQTGWLLLLALLARPDNFYWAALAVPLSLGGLVLLPRLLGDARGGKREAEGDRPEP